MIFRLVLPSLHLFHHILYPLFILDVSKHLGGYLQFPITGVLPFALDILAKTPTCQGDEIGRVVELIAWIPKKAAPRMTRCDLQQRWNRCYDSTDEPICCLYMLFIHCLQILIHVCKFPFCAQGGNFAQRFHNLWIFAALPSDFSTPMCLMISNSTKCGRCDAAQL